MGALTDAGENLALNFFVAGSFTAPTTLYLALHSDSQSDSSAGTEITGGSYVRKAVTWGTVSGGAVSNSADINFDGMPAVPSPGITSGSLWTASTGGTRLWYGDIAAQKTLNSGDTFKVAAGSLTLTLD